MRAHEHKRKKCRPVVNKSCRNKNKQGLAYSKNKTKKVKDNNISCKIKEGMGPLMATYRCAQLRSQSMRTLASAVMPATLQAICLASPHTRELDSHPI